MPKEIQEIVHIELTKEETLQLLQMEILLKKTRNMIKTIRTRRYSDGLQVLQSAIEELYKVYSEFACHLSDDETAEIDQLIEDLDDEFERP